LPDFFGEFIFLTDLNLRKNKITTLPMAIEGLKKLKNLDISKNKLKSLPKNFGNLGDLVMLDITEN
jgi:Leucine-rich repeat (LRR) protein